MVLSKMEGEPNRIAPPVIWAQRKDKLYLTLNVEDCKDPVIKFEKGSVYFRGHGGVANRSYEVTLELFGEINAAESKYVVLARHIPLIVRKAEGAYWPRLLKNTTKVHWLKTDFNKWRDEDDSDAEEGNDMQFEEMMKQMGNFKTEGNGMEADDEDDSDDEDLPDLETNDPPAA